MQDDGRDGKKIEKEYIYNTDTEDFTITYDVEGMGSPQTFTIASMETASFPPIIARHIKKHLANKIIFKRGIKTNFDDDYKKVLQEISADNILL